MSRVCNFPRSVLETKRERTRSESRRREVHHMKLAAAAENEADVAVSERKRNIAEKMAKVDKILEEREEERRKSRQHALKMMRLKETVRYIIGKIRIN